MIRQEIVVGKNVELPRRWAKSENVLPMGRNKLWSQRSKF
jgi:hypothetical protein